MGAAPFSCGMTEKRGPRVEQHPAVFSPCVPLVSSAFFLFNLIFYFCPSGLSAAPNGEGKGPGE